MGIIIVNSVIRSMSMIHPFHGIRYINIVNIQIFHIANLCKLRYLF